MLCSSSPVVACAVYMWWTDVLCSDQTLSYGRMMNWTCGSHRNYCYVLTFYSWDCFWSSVTWIQVIGIMIINRRRNFIILLRGFQVLHSKQQWFDIQVTAIYFAEFPLYPHTEPEKSLAERAITIVTNNLGVATVSIPFILLGEYLMNWTQNSNQCPNLNCSTSSNYLWLKYSKG